MPPNPPTSDRYTCAHTGYERRYVSAFFKQQLELVEQRNGYLQASIAFEARSPWQRLVRGGWLLRLFYHHALAQMDSEILDSYMD